MAANILIKDGGGVNVTVKTTEDLGPPVVHTPHHIVDSIITSALPTGAATSALQTAANTDLAAMEVLLGTIDADTSLIATTNTLLTAANVDHAANEVLIAATNTLLTTIDADTSLIAATNTLLTTIDSDTNDIKTAVEILDNAISGSEMQVDVVSVALPTTGFTGITFYEHSGGAAVQLAASGALKSGVTVKAYSGNAAAIFVGFSNITATTSGTNTTGGIELAAKESIFIEVDSLSDVYIRGGADGLVTYIGT